MRNPLQTATLLAVALTLGACGIGQPPSMTPIGQTEDGAQPILTPERAAIAVPPPQAAKFAYQQGSLWNTSKSGLLGDRRARTLGDILTISIEIDEEAEMENDTDRSRSGSQSASVGAFFGIGNYIPSEIDMLNPNLELESDSGFRGSGSTKRNEKLTLRVAATVVNVLPNGHLVIQGDQVRVNFELRELQVTGIVRPEDINRYNEIEYDRIAGARISYGGRGQITSAQQPRYGQQAIDKVMPY
jgi:flagellar L-ring protein precursor FlgH